MGQSDRPDDRRAAGSRLSSNSESAVKGITKRRNPESQNARKPRPAPGFLAKSNTCSGQITAMFQSLPNSSRPTKEDLVNKNLELLKKTFPSFEAQIIAFIESWENKPTDEDEPTSSHKI